MSRNRITDADGMETSYGFETVSGKAEKQARVDEVFHRCLLYTSPSPRD